MAVMMLLRLGVVQALYMDTPAFAAVDTTVRLAERDENTRPFKGLINAVLRGLLRQPPAEADPEANAPGWLFARWRAAYGEAAARAIAAMIVQEPAPDLTLLDSNDAAALCESIGAVELRGGSLRVGHRGDVAGWPGYAEGRWWVQDAAAAIPARVAAARADETAIDLCAAPGGKLLQLARAGGGVVGLDRSAPRLRRVASALERTSLKAEVVQADAGSWSDPRQFDVVLLDAPCSATGTFRRHPDVLWGTRPPDIAKLAGVQTRLLNAAAGRVAPGGRLIYCVCSLEPEEGEQQVDAFLKRHADFRPIHHHRRRGRRAGGLGHRSGLAQNPSAPPGGRHGRVFRGQNGARIRLRPIKLGPSPLAGRRGPAGLSPRPNYSLARRFSAT